MSDPLQPHGLQHTRPPCPSLFPGVCPSSSPLNWWWYVDVYSYHFLLDHVQFILIHGPNLQGSYAVLFFTASDFAFTTRHIHSRGSFLLSSSHFILSGAISNCPPLFPGSILDTFQHGGEGMVHLLVSYLFAFLYCSWSSHARILEWFAIPLYSGSCFVRFLTVTHLPCIAWLIASLSYASPFATTRQWSMMGSCNFPELNILTGFWWGL